MEEGSRFLKGLVSVILGVLFLALSGFPKIDSIVIAFQIGSGGFFLTFLVYIWATGLAAYDSHVSTWENFASTFGKLDDEARATMGFAFPRLRYTIKRGEPRQMFEDTNVPIEIFRTFLQTSNDRYVSPRRDWYTKDQPEWAWIEIKDWLEAKGYIVPDSAAGQHSWLWSGSSYQKMKAYWWMAGRKLVDLNRAGEAAYPYEEEAVELEK